MIRKAQNTVFADREGNIGYQMLTYTSVDGHTGPFQYQGMGHEWAGFILTIYRTSRTQKLVLLPAKVRVTPALQNVFKARM